MTDHVQQAARLFGGAVTLVPGGVKLADPSALKSPATDRLVRQAVFGGESEREAARWLLWELAQITGARPASINDLYLARGRGECGGFTVPAINIRMLAYDSARAVFRAALAGRAGAIILEIARSEIAYTAQRPDEYVAVLIGAALREGYTHPLFIQGDHCQVNAKKYAERPRGRGGRGQEAHRRGGGRRLLQHRRGHLHPGGPLAAHPRGAAARQLRALRRDHRLHPGARARGRHRLGGRGDRRGGPQEQHGGGAPRLHEGLSRHAGPARASRRG